MRHLIAPALLVGLTSTAIGQGLNVAIVAAASSNSTDCRYSDPQMMLTATGMFAAVDVIDAAVAAPTLAQLIPYDAIITWANVPYADPVATGEVFADYVDLGGGVVCCMFALGAGSGGVTPLQLAGRWAPTYEMVDPNSGQTSGQATLGAVHDPSHPVMAGVTTFDGGIRSYRPRTTMLHPGSQSIADWSDGTILVAVGTMPNRVDLGMYPPSSLCNAEFWDSTTDGALLMANALVHSAGDIGPGTSYCDPAATNSTGVPAELSVSGSSLLAMNDVTLVAQSLPLNSFGFFVVSQMRGFVPNAGGSAGNLCLSGMIGRYVGPGQIQNSGSSGSMSLAIDVTQVPQPTGFVSIASGETWNFQAWFRDSSPGGATSNFTQGVEVTFQ
ncbi:hypothetical protein N9185_00150 [bacterium]|nr:hypothetical protein [bacterium]MDB4561765.1 hypothetical protein [bacterium]